MASKCFDIIDNVCLILLIHFRTCITKLRHDRLCEENDEVLNFIKTVEYFNIMDIVTLGARGWYI